MDTNFNAPIPQDAIDYLNSKGYTASYYWQDTWKEAHAQAFTVAKMLKLDLLQDVHGALLQALSEGQTYEEFAKGITPTLQAKGWWGQQKMQNPYTSKDEDVQLGSPKRLEKIYRTNIDTAYQAGHYKAMNEVKDMLPYWQYLAVMDSSTRGSHKLLHKKVFRADDPIWATIYPPNDWGCRCTVRALSEEQVKQMGLAVESGENRIKVMEIKTPNGDTRQHSVYIDPTSGNRIAIGEGWDYNVGKSWIDPFVAKPYIENNEMSAHKKIGFESDKTAIKDIVGVPKDNTRLLPDGLKPEEYIQKFLGEFGARVGEPMVYKDKVGDAVIISERLFLTNKSQPLTDANTKVVKENRHRDLVLLADTIKNPDEIWLTPTQDATGKVSYNKRYIKFFDDKDYAAGYSAFILRQNEGAWEGRTVFPYKKVERQGLDNTRIGKLIYKKG